MATSLFSLQVHNSCYAATDLQSVCEPESMPAFSLCNRAEIELTIKILMF